MLKQVFCKENIKPCGRVLLDDGKNRKEYTNTITRSGAHYLACAAAGKFTDFGGVPSNLYIGLGSDNSTNAMVPGPITGNKPVGGPWNGPSFNDWRRTNKLAAESPFGELPYRQADSVKIVNEMITIFATFPDATFPYPTNPIPPPDKLPVTVREVVVGIGSHQPESDPYDAPAQKIYTILARAVMYSIVSGFYVDDPYVKSYGGNLTVRYQIRFA